MLPVRVILHPTDFSERAGHAFDLACSLARDYGARLVLVHVKPPQMVYGEMVPLPPEPSDVRQTLQERLSQLRPPDPNMKVERYLREGDPAAEILRLVQETQCDLIVLGTHGRTGLGRLLMGSVAEEVLRKAPCPVLTVKSPLPEGLWAEGTRQESATT